MEAVDINAGKRVSHSGKFEMTRFASHLKNVRKVIVHQPQE